MQCLEDKWSANTKPDLVPAFKSDERKFPRLPLRSHLMYTNRWNLYKAKRLKAEPLCPFSQLGIYFTTSIEPAVSGRWREGRAQFWGPITPRFPKTMLVASPTDEEASPASYRPNRILPSAGSQVAPLLLCVALDLGKASEKPLLFGQPHQITCKSQAKGGPSKKWDFKFQKEMG